MTSDAPDDEPTPPDHAIPPADPAGPRETGGDGGPTALFDRWAREARDRDETPPIPAATVVVLRDGPTGLETLMLRRNSRIAFGGMWVFPGGRIDEADHEAARAAGRPGLEGAARHAAAREAGEEAALVVDPATLVPFAHWVPPPIAPKRFATWFFAARAGTETVEIDRGEIVHHQWMRPADALTRRDAGEIELAPPTWVTLHTLSAHADVDAALAALAAGPVRRYRTRVARLPEGPVALWEGDAGYESADPTRPGPRHRLVMAADGFRFHDDGAPR